MDNGEYLFRVFRSRIPIVVLLMDSLGDNRRVYNPGGKGWPTYPSVQPYLDLWLDLNVGHTFPTREREIVPGDRDYPKALANALSRDPLLNLWAYAVPRHIFVSLSQVAHALGENPTARLRERLREQGLNFVFRDGRHLVSLVQVHHRLGEVVDRIALYPTQVGDFLGVWPRTAAGIIRRLGLAVPGRRTIAVSWGDLRRVRRLGPRTFVVQDL